MYVSKRNQLKAPTTILPTAKEIKEWYGCHADSDAVMLPMLGEDIHEQERALDKRKARWSTIDDASASYRDMKGTREGATAMPTKQNQREDEGEELRQDPRVGKRVICLSLLPSLTLLGTIQRIMRSANDIEYWKVLADGLMIEEGPSSSFHLYDGPEFQAGDRVKYRLDEGGYWVATVVQPQWTLDHLRFLIRVDSDEHAAVKVKKGHAFAAHSGWLSNL